jgi:glutaminyl-tRNA synthetase
MSENIRNRNFIEQIIDEHNERERFGSRVHTRFPPEPNGYLHIGHAKSICLNFGIAQEYKRKTNLRFDDTNPVAEDTEYVDAIREDVKWLGFDWEEREFYASDYFQKLYDLAVELIKRGKAYVDDSTAEEVAEMKGTPTVAGTASKYRNRSIEENLTLLEGMKNGDFPDGARVLRAKIDLTSPNMHLRDPLMYRIKNVEHHRTGDAWHIYPMYDFAHGISDSIEGVTHSICTLEFEVHRPLYEWFLEALDLYKPQQIEFARLNLSYTIMSKRRLKRLVEEGYVNGWDDPRMPTISGLRRRGYTPASIRLFAEKIGVARRENIIDVSLLEFCVKEDLNKITDRVMAVLNPLKVTITNYPEGKTEEMEAINNPGDESAGSRIVPFSRELYIERTDFLEDAPRKFFRLSIGKMVRLKNAYIIQCDEAIKDENGEVIELKCSYIENSRSGEDTSGLKVKGTIHWVSIPHAVEAEVRLYDRLFTDESPNGHKDKDFLEFINPESLEVITGYVEPHLKTVKAGESVQFMRIGYFAVDKDTTDEKLVFNRTVALRDNWKKKK